MKDVKKTRRFEGKLYKLHDWYVYKTAAKVEAGTLRARGYLVRLTVRPESKCRGGYPLCDLYYLWIRRER